MSFKESNKSMYCNENLHYFLLLLIMAADRKLRLPVLIALVQME